MRPPVDRSEREDGAKALGYGPEEAGQSEPENVPTHVGKTIRARARGQRSFVGIPESSVASVTTYVRRRSARGARAP